MKIDLQQISIRDLAEGYTNHPELGVAALDGKLNVRPAYQREFVYKDKQRDAVIHTVRNGFPLNSIYWAVNPDGTMEVLDGQQRIISICDYVHRNFSIEFQYFHNLTQDQQDAILDYPLMVYICEGSESEKLEWFRTINIAGEPLTDQELRNAVYTGPWLADAKRHFSKSGGPAEAVGRDYLKGSAIRQDFLQTAIQWHSYQLYGRAEAIERYMSEHQHEKNAGPLWLHFQAVINWVKNVFPKYRKEMKGADWGALYTDHSRDALDAGDLEKRVSELLMDDDVTNKKGVYAYVLTGDERHLNIRGFTEAQRRQVYERQGGLCAIQGKPYELKDMHADHITPWSKGGKTVVDNCQMICADENRKKSNI